MSREHSSDERGPEHHLHLKQQGKMPTSDPAMLSRPISEDVVEVRFLDGMDSGDVGSDVANLQALQAREDNTWLIAQVHKLIGAAEGERTCRRKCCRRGS
ncbi:hypothetical protein KCU71_g41, partial [Aureobasidium melanogenum]